MTNKEIEQKLAQIDKKIEQFKNKEEQLKVLTALCEQDEVREVKKVKGYYKEVGRLFKDKKDPVYMLLNYAKQIFEKDHNAANIAITNGIQRSRELKELEKNILGKDIEKEITEMKGILKESGLEISKNQNQFLDNFKESLSMDIASINRYRRQSQQLNNSKEQIKDIQGLSDYLKEMDNNIKSGKKQIEDIEIEKNINNIEQQFEDIDSEKKERERRRSSGISFRAFREKRHLNKERRISELGEEAQKIIPMILEQAAQKVQEGMVYALLEEKNEKIKVQEISPSIQFSKREQETQTIIDAIKKNSKEHNNKMPLQKFDESPSNISKENDRTIAVSKDMS